MRRDAFGVDDGFIRCHIQMQILLVDTSEGTQIRPKRRTYPFAGGKRSPGAPSYAAGCMFWSMSAGVGSKDGAGAPQSAASQAAVT